MTPAWFPDEEAVLSHGFDLRPWWWQARTPDTWSAFLSALPTAERGNGYCRITRADLFARACDHSAPADGALLVACYAWGTGDSGWLVPRRARVFRDTPPVEVSARLSDARRVLVADGPAAAYESLADWGANRIKHMRASFFTKFLYAADAGMRARGRALILDQFVAIALNDLHAWGLPERGPWPADDYRRWLSHAEAEAASASTVGRHVRPDAVEMAYFKHGRALEQARRRRVAT